MTQLTILRLDHNDLSFLPNEVGELKFLEELTFCDNKIISIPQCFG